MLELLASGSETVPFRCLFQNQVQGGPFGSVWSVCLFCPWLSILRSPRCLAGGLVVIPCSILISHHPDPLFRYGWACILSPCLVIVSISRFGIIDRHGYQALVFVIWMLDIGYWIGFLNIVSPCMSCYCTYVGPMSPLCLSI